MNESDYLQSRFATKKNVSNVLSQILLHLNINCLLLGGSSNKIKFEEFFFLDSSKIPIHLNTFKRLWKEEKAKESHNESESVWIKLVKHLHSYANVKIMIYVFKDLWNMHITSLTLNRSELRSQSWKNYMISTNLSRFLLFAIYHGKYLFDQTFHTIALFLIVIIWLVLSYINYLPSYLHTCFPGTEIN